MSKYCKNCGKRIDDDSAYCQYCGKNQSCITEHGIEIVSTGESVLAAESIVNAETILESESIDEKETVKEDCKNVEDESKILTVDDETRQEESQESSDLSFFDYWLRKVGIICAIVIFAFILFGILTAIRQFSKEWLGNSALYWTTISFLIGAVVFYIAKRFKGKNFKEHFESIFFTLAVIGIIIVSIVGRVITSQKETKVPVENILDMKVLKLSQDNNKLKELVQKANLALPETVDEYTIWTNIRIEGNVVVCTYRMNDATFDMYDIDVVEYKKDLEENIASHHDKRFLKLCASTNKDIKFRIVSQFDASKSFEILFGNLEIEDLANR